MKLVDIFVDDMMRSRHVFLGRLILILKWKRNIGFVSLDYISAGKKEGGGSSSKGGEKGRKGN